MCVCVCCLCDVCDVHVCCGYMSTYVHAGTTHGCPLSHSASFTESGWQSSSPTHPPASILPIPGGKDTDIFIGAGNLNSGPHTWTSSDFTLVVSPGSQPELLKCQKFCQNNIKICMYSLNFPKIPFVLIFSEFPTNGLTHPINKFFTIRKFKNVT